jgi:aspartate-semialdehyde dehydrogenase
MFERKSAYSVGVVGATGAVGREIVKTLKQREFPVGRLRLFASERSVGETVEFGRREIPVQALHPDVFEDLDLALFSAGAAVSLDMATEAADRGCVVVDNSSAWRGDPLVPLVVPEVNPDDLADFENRNIVANPNCSTIQMVVALKPIADKVGLRRVVVTTLQSVSGAGQKGIDELSSQVRQLFNGLPAQPTVHSHQMAFNCIPQIGAFREDGYTDEEWKLVAETRRLLGLPDLEVSPTAVRVPVFCGHAESIQVQTLEPISADEVRELLTASPGIEVLDEPGESVYPTPFGVTGKDAVRVGRIRKDPFQEDVLNLWVVADNMRKGAALNAVQILELLVEDPW